MKEELPRAYREGRAEFYGREFLVTPEVLIPRPETEMMVDAVLNLYGKAILPGVRAGARRLPLCPRVLDVGTGSGVVGITLKLEIPEAEVYMSDVSLPALKVARENARRFGAEVWPLKGDLLEDLQGLDKDSGGFCSAEQIPENFEVIVANLPYVDRDWEWLDKEALSVEPELALYAGDGGLELIFRLIEEIVEKGALTRGGFLVLEADPIQHERVIEFAKERGLGLEEVRGFQIVLRKIK